MSRHTSWIILTEFSGISHSWTLGIPRKPSSVFAVKLQISIIHFVLASIIAVRNTAKQQGCLIIWHQPKTIRLPSLKLTANAPENRPKPNRKVVFQISVFRGNSLVSRSVVFSGNPSKFHIPLHRQLGFPEKHRSKILMIPEGSTSVSDEFGTKTFYPKNPGTLIAWRHFEDLYIYTLW